MARQCSKGLVIIPAYNEEDSIVSVLLELRRVRPDLDVIIIDDGSTDSTRILAEEMGIRVIGLPFNLGVGGAMRAGFRYAADTRYKYTVQVDADGQHDPSFIETLERALEHADVVVGSRFSGEDIYRVTRIRRWTMKFLAFTLTAICHTRLTDTTSGFRATGPAALSLFATHYPSEYLGDTVESLVLAHRAGLTITEVPVRMRTRLSGEPSTPPVTATLYLIRAAMVLLVTFARSKVPPPIESN